MSFLVRNSLLHCLAEEADCSSKGRRYVTCDLFHDPSNSNNIQARGFQLRVVADEDRLLTETINLGAVDTNFHL